MTLFQDMQPDRDWNKRGNLEKSGAMLTLQRAHELHASIAVRNYGIWAIILTAYGTAVGLDFKTNPLLLWTCWVVMAGLLCFYCGISFLDSDRNQSVNEIFSIDTSTRRHVLEDTAIPALCFGWIIVFVLRLLWWIWDLDPASSLYEPLKWILITLEGLPLLGLTALMMAIGAWLRWHEASFVGADVKQVAT